MKAFLHVLCFFSVLGMLALISNARLIQPIRRDFQPSELAQVMNVSISESNSGTSRRELITARVICQRKYTIRSAYTDCYFFEKNGLNRHLLLALNPGYDCSISAIAAGRTICIRGQLIIQ
eukprot:TRINITY_DN3537_c0_g1_i9.p2 TRINITY_DN3537_c0_g1~~TRINITY_DN3537_c0_g1_i9.p2  ORF type:complete len:121 (+),score=12.92 TRINITY_DN3537_c0_g1_i9:72-434(+)